MGKPKPLGDLFNEDATVCFCAIRCKVCGTFSLGGIDWYREHKCPEPYSMESAQMIYDSVVGGPPISPRMKARLVMSWRYGYIKTSTDRIVEEMERQFHQPL